MRFDHDIEVTPGDIRRAWGEIMDGRNPFSENQDGSSVVASHMRNYRAAEPTPTVLDWIGATGAEINHRLTHGYAVDAADLKLDGGSTEFVMPQPVWDEEEGDLTVDAVMAGEDAYRVQWEDVEAPRSLTIRACIGMAAAADAKVLGAYMTWLLQVIDAAQRQGISPDVELWIGTSGSFQRHPKEKMRVRIPLVKAGEMVDVDSWRAYLTPGAFRSLGFVAIALAADRTRLKRRLTYGLGSPTNKTWNVTLEDGVLDIECPGVANDFPAEHMTELLTQAGL